MGKEDSLPTALSPYVVCPACHNNKNNSNCSICGGYGTVKREVK